MNYKKVLLIGSVLFQSLLSPVPTYAITIPTPVLPTIEITTVKGHITGPDGKDFKLANVTITCGPDTKHTITNGQGNFVMIFAGKNACKAGDTAFITAEKDGKSGSGSGIVQLRRDGRVVDVNFSVLNFSLLAVPEYNWVTASIAVLGGLGVLTLLRKKVFVKA